MRVNWLPSAFLPLASLNLKCSMPVDMISLFSRLVGLSLPYSLACLAPMCFGLAVRVAAGRTVGKGDGPVLTAALWHSPGSFAHGHAASALRCCLFFLHETIGHWWFVIVLVVPCPGEVGKPTESGWHGLDEDFLLVCFDVKLSNMHAFRYVW